MDFKKLFEAVHPDCKPYPFQVDLAIRKTLPEIIECPTGLGKTDAIVGAWIYRRFFCDDPTIRFETPNTLCCLLPMRTLTLQTGKVAERWREVAQGLATESHDPEMLGRLEVVRLMGGEDCTAWDTQPGVSKILVGTQDMILSRALNRGYAMSRYRWPIEFGQLNNDILTVLDETQLIGVGVSTAAQLEGFRQKLKTFGTTHTIFMSATLDDRMLDTVDHPRPNGDFIRLKLSNEDLKIDAVKKLTTAPKPIQRADLDFLSNTYTKDLVAMVLENHRPETTTLVISNRVAQARKIYGELEKLVKKQEEKTLDLVLIHSRFRPQERDTIEKRILDGKQEESTESMSRIIVATQAVEAGVDISATTLFTELAPWPSLVQRFGRCNRRGEDSNARVVWIDIPTDEKNAKKNSPPYEPGDMDAARAILLDPTLREVSLDSLESLRKKGLYVPPLKTVPVIREKDILELWDTTPDLLGNDMDVSRYIRESEDTDVLFFWREWEGSEKGRAPLQGEPGDDAEVSKSKKFAGPGSEELCTVRIGEARTFLKNLHEKQGIKAFGFNPLNPEKPWEAIRHDRIWPGMTLLLPKVAGGYSETLGWTGDSKDQNFEVLSNDEGEVAETNDADPPSKQVQRCVTLPDHNRQVLEAIHAVRQRLPFLIDESLWNTLEQAAWWHDAGKSHDQFLCRYGQEPDGSGLFYAKFSNAATKPISSSPKVDDTSQDKRPGFRHELAGAIAYLLHHQKPGNSMPDLNANLDSETEDSTEEDRENYVCGGQLSCSPEKLKAILRQAENAVTDEREFHNLVAYLIASHHGKVRGSIRSLPNEKKPGEGRLFARGVWDGDELPETKLGNEIVMPKTTLDLRYMELGTSELGPSWLSRVMELRRRWGPFRLAMLEAIFRTADWEASKEEVNDHE